MITSVFKGYYCLQKGYKKNEEQFQETIDSTYTGTFHDCFGSML